MRFRIILRFKTQYKPYQSQERWFSGNPNLPGVFPSKKYQLKYAVFAFSLILFSTQSVATLSIFNALPTGVSGMPFVPTVEPDYQVEITD